MHVITRFELAEIAGEFPRAADLGHGDDENLKKVFLRQRNWARSARGAQGRIKQGRAHPAHRDAPRRHARPMACGSTRGSWRWIGNSEKMARCDPATHRLATIPGVRVLNATALVAAIGDGRTFSRSRDLAAWLGLVPRQATTGGKLKLLGITKRGSKYLRKIIIQGARSVMPSLARTPTPIGAWLRGLLSRAHSNRVVVALAAKLVRVAWSLLRNGTSWSAGHPAAA